MRNMRGTKRLGTRAVSLLASFTLAFALVPATALAQDGAAGDTAPAACLLSNGVYSLRLKNEVAVAAP